MRCPDILLNSLIVCSIMPPHRKGLAHLFIALFIFVGSTVAAEITPPGTLIYNRAELSYLQVQSAEDDVPASESGLEVITVSNVVSVGVGYLYQYSVENTYQLTVEAGSTVQFPHRIINSGNALDRYEISFPGLDTAAFTDPEVYLDLNHNGKVDSDEPLAATVTALNPGEYVDVIVAGRVSAEIAYGDVKEFRFSVSADNSSDVAMLVNSVVVGSAAMNLTLATAPACSVSLYPGETVTHTVNAHKLEAESFNAWPYLVDNETVEGLVIQLPVASNLSYTGFVDSAVMSFPGIRVVRLKGDSEFRWNRADSLDPELADQVVSAGLLVDPAEFAPGHVASFSIANKVVFDLDNQSISSSEAIVDLRTDGIPDVISNSSCNRFATWAAADEEPLLQFVQPARAFNETGSVPDFFSFEDFEVNEKFALKRGSGDLYSVVRDGVYLQLDLKSLNHSDVKKDTAGNRYIISTITSSLTSDVVNVVMLETERAGVFRSIAPVALSETNRSNGGFCPAVPDGQVFVPEIDALHQTCVLQSANSDLLTGSFGNLDAGFQTAINAYVDSMSVVFDSLSRRPVPGAVVRIVEVGSNEVGVDVWTGKRFEFTTGADGRYPVPPRLLESKNYYLHVDTPIGYQFPSVVPADDLVEYEVNGFSYGELGFADSHDPTGVFSGFWINNQLRIDIPLDPIQIDRFLTIDKVASQKVADVGQSVSYTISVSNSIDAPVVEVGVEDTLPFGFRYVSGSTLVRGESVTDPVRMDNGSYVFDLGDLEPGETAEIKYALRTTAAALDSNGINTVIAKGKTESDNPTESMPARARVKMQKSGVFSNQAALFGKVYVDQNCDGLHNNKEWPIGGVRLYLHDGTYVISDADGLFSLYGLNPGQYVITLDPHTLPDGLSLKLMGVDQAADPGSYFVDLTAGDFYRIEFAAGCPSDAEKVFEEIKLRNNYLDRGWALDQADTLHENNSGSYSDRFYHTNAADGDLSNGVVDGPAGISVGSTVSDENDKGQTTGQRHSDDVGDSSDKPILDAKKVVSSITREQAKSGTWLWPLEDLSITGRFMVVVRAGIDPTLYVNGKAVADTHIGERLVNRREKAQVVAWYGVELDEGENVVEVKGTGPFGNERVLATRKFKRPSVGTKIELHAQSKTIPADGGKTTLPIKVRILDKNGYPALGVYFLTLESTDGSWVERDIQDSEPGRQIRVENGERVIHYRTSGVTGEVRLRASTSDYSDDLVVLQVPESRPLLVTGFISGSVSSGEQLGEFSKDTDLDDLRSESQFEKRATVFVKGQVKGKYNLTLSYDSDKQSGEELFRDVNPALHYPIQGDSSIRGFEAQSRSKLYFKLERDQNSVMWGDFATNPDGDQHDLAKINRSLTGFNGFFKFGKNNIKVFAAEEKSRNIVEEIPGNGSALSYRLRQYPILSNSESIELLTRSRENPGLVLDTVKLSRFGDYTIDDELGFLSFTSVVPTVDQDQNPVFIRISYDVAESDDSYLVSGLHINRIIGEHLIIGGGISYDGNESDGMLVTGFYGDFRFGEKTELSLSVASSDSNSLGTGMAHRLSFEHRWSGDLESVTSLTHASADERFSNSGVGVTFGRRETRLRHLQRLGEKTTFIADANRSSSSTMDDDRSTVSATIETRMKEWDLWSGLSHISQKGLGGNQDSLTAILGARRKFKLLGKDASGNMELEQDIESASKRRISLGAKVSLHDKVSAYGNYEFTNHLLGIGGFVGNNQSESLTIGVESRILPSTRLYSEYRHRDVFENMQQESVAGIRSDYEISKGLSVSPSFEYIKTFGAVGQDSIGASIGLRDIRNPHSRKSLRLETRQSDGTDHYGLRASLVSRINLDWTATLRDDFSRQVSDGTDPVQRHTFTAALARRPKYNNKHHMLFMYKHKQESGVSKDVEHSSHVLSTHQNIQLNRGTTLSGRLGFKHDHSLIDYTRISDFSALIDTRASYELNRRLNLYVGAGALSTNDFSEFRFSAGLGANFTINRNLRLNVGYNVIGFREEDLDIGNYNAEGARIGLQYKLNSELFKWLK